MAGLNNSTPHENNFFNLDFQFALFFVCFVLVLSPFQSLLFMILAYIILSINGSKTGFPCHLIGHHETSRQKTKSKNILVAKNLGFTKKFKFRWSN